jgi:hypothetical protein
MVKEELFRIDPDCYRDGCAFPGCRQAGLLPFWTSKKYKASRAINEQTLTAGRNQYSLLL